MRCFRQNYMPYYQSKNLYHQVSDRILLLIMTTVNVTIFDIFFHASLQALIMYENFPHGVVRLKTS